MATMTTPSAGRADDLTIDLLYARYWALRLVDRPESECQAWETFQQGLLDRVEAMPLVPETLRYRALGLATIFPDGFDELFDGDTTDTRLVRGILDTILADAHVAVPQPPSRAWTDALTAYEQTTEAAAVIDGDRDEDAFDKAATAQGAAIDTLLDTPAPDMAALATKLRVMHRDGYQHRLAAVLADAERLTEPQPDAGHADWLRERNVLIDRLDGDHADDDADDGASKLNRLDNLVIETPAVTTTDVFAKLLLGMQLLSEGHHLIEGDAAGIVEEARRIVGIGRASPFASRKTKGARS